jgi:hypothetical protein
LNILWLILSKNLLVVIFFSWMYVIDSWRKCVVCVEWKGERKSKTFPPFKVCTSHHWESSLFSKSDVEIHVVVILFLYMYNIWIVVIIFMLNLLSSGKNYTWINKFDFEKFSFYYPNFLEFDLSLFFNKSRIFYLFILLPLRLKNTIYHYSNENVCVWIRILLLLFLR